MIFEKFIDKDLGHVSFLIGCDSTKQAIIIDPRRDIDCYLDYIHANQLQLTYIFNTHTHADYIGGHVELASKYAVPNIFHKSAPIKNYPVTFVEDGDTLRAGTLDVRIMATPGHTPFDISLLVRENNIEKYLFTGDFLFVGDIGRPDLLGEETMASLVEMSYFSAKKLWELDDSIVLFTSHIKGSLCGKNLSTQYFSSIGIEKKTNKSFILCTQSKEQYTENLLSQKLETPAFFKKMAFINIAGPELVQTIKSNLQYVAYETIADNASLQLVDLRHPNQFHAIHIPGAINIYEHSNVSLIAGNILSYENDIYLIGDETTDFDQCINKLLRVGLDKILGIVKEPWNTLPICKSSKLIADQEIRSDTLEIMLDPNHSSNTGAYAVSSSINTFRDVEIAQYDQVIVSCVQNYKSSAVASSLMKTNTNIFVRKPSSAAGTNN